MELEILAIGQDFGPPNTVYSTTGDWFPALTGFVSPVSFLDALKCIDETAREHGLNREQRRALKQKTFKRNTLRDEDKRSLLAKQEEGLKEILNIYPMREKDALVLHNYVFGKATVKDVEDAFLASLRDPRWMMKWFEKHTNQLSPIIEWCRGPSENMRQTILGIAAQVRELRDKFPALGESSHLSGFDSSGKRRMQMNVLASVTARLATTLNVSGDSVADHACILKNAPGLTVAISTAIDSMWNSISEKPRDPKASDFVDIVHALYVPYVDVFRADSYMAPLISAAAKPYGTTIVGRLKDIVGAIERQLALQ